MKFTQCIMNVMSSNERPVFAVGQYARAKMGKFSVVLDDADEDGHGVAQLQKVPPLAVMEDKQTGHRTNWPSTSCRKGPFTMHHDRQGEYRRLCNFFHSLFVRFRPSRAPVRGSANLRLGSTANVWHVVEKPAQGPFRWKPFNPMLGCANVGAFASPATQVWLVDKPNCLKCPVSLSGLRHHYFYGWPTIAKRNTR